MTPSPAIPPSNPQRFGELVHARRTQLGLSQAALSASAHLGAGYLSELESGRRPAPPRATAERIACSLKLSGIDLELLVARAEVERAFAEDARSGLTPELQELLVELRVAAPRLDKEMVNQLRGQLRHASNEASSP